MDRLYDYWAQLELLRKNSMPSKYTTEKGFPWFHSWVCIPSPGARIHNFKLVIWNPEEYIADVKLLIKFAVSKKVEVLDLNFWSFYEIEFLELPLCVFKHEALRVLKLTQCDLMRVEFPRFCAPKSLHLGRIRLSISTLGTNLSACHLLEMLALDNCTC